jgi:hypothetical protein
MYSFQDIADWYENLLRVCNKAVITPKEYNYSQRLHVGQNIYTHSI